VASANPVLDLTMTGPHDIQAQFVPVLSSAGTDLGVGTMGAPYRDTLTAAGGTGTYQWRRLTGTLPLGLTLVPEGVVLGRPAASGAYTLVVEVTSGSQRDTATVALEIGEPVLAMAAVVNKLVGLARRRVLPRSVGQQRWHVRPRRLPRLDPVGCRRGVA